MMVEFRNADPVLTAIGAGQMLPYETVMKTARWVSEGLKDEVSNWDYSVPGKLGPILINAPTGSGKSTFVLKDLAERTAKFGKSVLLLSNRSALELQQKYGMSQNCGWQWSGEALSEITHIRNVMIATYQSIWKLRDTSNIAVVVFDEAHFFSSDATFNAYTSDIFRHILLQFPMAQRIYMSATPDVVRDLIAHEEYVLRGMLIHNNSNSFTYLRALTSKHLSIKEFKFTADYSYVDLSIFAEWEDDIVQKIISNERDEKWLIFVSDKASGKSLKKRLGKIAEYIDAETKIEKTQYFQDLVRRERFDKKVLITTSALDNGVNFKDDSLVHVVIDSTDPVEVMQMLGRKRIGEGDQVKVYIMHKSQKQIDEERSRLTADYKMLRDCWMDAQGFLKRVWGHLTPRQQKLIQLDNNGTPKASAYAPYQINCRMAQLEELSDQLAGGDEAAFEKEVCRWFGKVLVPGMMVQVPTEEKRRKLLMEIYERGCEESPLNREEMEQLQKEILAAVKDYTDSELGIRKGEERLKANINNLANRFGLPFKCEKKDKQWIVSCK